MKDCRCECEFYVIQNFQRTVCIGRELLILYKMNKSVDMHDFNTGLNNFHPQLGALLRVGALGPGPVGPLDKTELFVGCVHAQSM